MIIALPMPAGMEADGMHFWCSFRVASAVLPAVRTSAPPLHGLLFCSAASRAQLRPDPVLLHCALLFIVAG